MCYRQGVAVSHQQAVWERALELRILLQRCLAAANRLPKSQVRGCVLPNNSMQPHPSATHVLLEHFIASTFYIRF